MTTTQTTRQPLDVGIKPTTPCEEYDGACTKGGYPHALIDGELTYLHRHVVETVEGRPLEPGEIVMHRCDNPPCIRYDHLVRATRGDNLRDAYAKGRRLACVVRGTANTNAKLTNRAVRTIRRRYRPGRGGNVAALARRYGVSTTVIHRIGKGTAWQHVK